MRVVLPGGSGQVGTMLARFFAKRGDEVVVLSRQPRTTAPWRTEVWDGRTEGAWTAAIDGADAVIHLSGRSVNCRYTPEHRREILESRTVPTELLARVIAGCQRPPRVWLNAATATIYRHSLTVPQDELSGEFGGYEKGVPASWAFSVGVGLAWEKALFEPELEATRRVALRTSMVMSPDEGGVFQVLSGLVRRGLGGTQGSGRQRVAWMHDVDFCRACLHLIESDVEGPVNLCAPEPEPNWRFMRELRAAWGRSFGLPATEAMLAVGARVMGTETELVLKSRYVVPTRLLQSGFVFEFPGWRKAAEDLVRRSRES